MRVIIAGDFVPCHRVADQINAGNFSCLDEAKPLIQSADYAIVNFESPVVMHDAKPIDKTGPNLRCTEKAMECIAYAGFKCVTLANNHFRDQGQVGVEDTLEACRKYGIDYVGGGKNFAEAQKVLSKTIDGQSLAIVNICENEWSIAGEDYGGSASLNPVRNYYAIKEAREKADFVIVIVHGGIEGYQYPTPRMQETYRFFVDAGADAVINHHQHCYCGYEEYHSKPIFYGLGNFCFDHKSQRGGIWNEGYLVELQLGGNGVGYEIIPYVQCNEQPAVILMDERKRIEFEEKELIINKIIDDLELLQKQFAEYLKAIGSYRLGNLEPIYNPYFRWLQQKGIVPNFIKGKALRDWFDRLNCESHRDVLCPLLKGLIEK